MFDDRAGIEVRYVKWQHLASLNVIRVSFEVDASQEKQLYKILDGMPQSSNQWFALARLNKQGKANDTKINLGCSDQTSDNLVHQKDMGESPSQPRPRRSWDELTPTQQAGIRCSEPRFKEFLETEFDAKWASSGYDVAHCVRVICNVPSRKNLIANPGRARWLALENQFQAWKEQK